MDGEFVIEETCGVTTDAVGGGNLLIIGKDRAGLLETSEAAVEAIAKVDDVITPFPGGIVRSGSKVGTKYKGMFASTNDAFCPTLRGTVKSELGPEVIAVLEIVIDGLTSEIGRGRHARRPQGHHRNRRGEGRHPRFRRQLRRQARPAPLSPEGPDLMSGFTLRLKAPAGTRLNLTGITPAKLASLSSYEIAKLAGRHGQGRRSPSATPSTSRAKPATRSPSTAPAPRSISQARASAAAPCASTATSAHTQAARCRAANSRSTAMPEAISPPA